MVDQLIRDAGKYDNIGRTLERSDDFYRRINRIKKILISFRHQPVSLQNEMIETFGFNLLIKLYLQWQQRFQDDEWVIAP